MRQLLPLFIYVALAAYAVSDVLQQRDSEPHGLHKILWVTMIVLIPYVGALAWIFTHLRGRLAEPPPRTLAPDDDPGYNVWLREQERRRKLDGPGAP